MELQLVQNEQFKVRKTQYQGDAWFVARDVAEILGYKNIRNALLTHVEDDDRITAQVDTKKGTRSTVLINEIGVYSMVLGSKLQAAKDFKRWICKEVIPSIRKTGAYMTDETLAKVQADPEALKELTTKLEEERSKHNETLKLLSQHEQTIREKDALIQRKNAYFERNKPRIDFAKAVYENKTAILVGEMAKLLNQNGIDIGQNRFFEWLRENGYLQSKQGEMWNVPYQKCIERGIFIIKESVTVDNRGKELITRTPMVTGKGQRYFISKFLETRDEEALAAITEEELKLQREDKLTPAGEDELDAYTNEENQSEAPVDAENEMESLVADGELESLNVMKNAGDELEPLNGMNTAGDDLDGIDE